MRNTKILNVRIPTELHDALTARATNGNESLAWATRYTLRLGLRTAAAEAQLALDSITPPPDPQRSAGGSRKGRRPPAKLVERFRIAKPARKARKGTK
jgi:hypothetical protein